jgi:hypothetical protein
MKRGKRVQPKHWSAKGAALIAVAMLLCCTVGGSLAWLVSNTASVTNTFTPGQVTSYVDESFDGTTKSNVKVTNTGNVRAYIRAAIVVNWADGDGNVSGIKPVRGTDYTLDLNLGEKWLEGSDDYYYYAQRVNPEKDTDVLIKSCKQTGSLTGYQLQVTILADAIQADGSDGSTPAVSSVWPAVAVNSDGTLRAASATK